MPSVFCPVCGGSGMEVKCFFAVPCHLCKANDIGNSHIGVLDIFFNRSYLELIMMAEQNPVYWAWLESNIQDKTIDPNAKVVRPKSLLVTLLEKRSALLKEEAEKTAELLKKKCKKKRKIK
jgi:hypothetical protein